MVLNIDPEKPTLPEGGAYWAKDRRTSKYNKYVSGSSLLRKRSTDAFFYMP